MKLPFPKKNLGNRNIFFKLLTNPSLTATHNVLNSAYVFYSEKINFLQSYDFVSMQVFPWNQIFVLKQHINFNKVSFMQGCYDILISTLYNLWWWYGKKPRLTYFKPQLTFATFAQKWKWCHKWGKFKVSKALKFFPRSFLKHACDKIAFRLFFYILFFWLLYLTFLFKSTSKEICVKSGVPCKDVQKMKREKFFLRKYHFWWFAQQR